MFNIRDDPCNSDLDFLISNLHHFVDSPFHWPTESHCPESPGVAPVECMRSPKTKCLDMSTDSLGCEEITGLSQSLAPATPFVSRAKVQWKYIELPPQSVFPIYPLIVTMPVETAALQRFLLAQTCPIYAD